MSNTRKPGKSKFPLTLHPIGQWCKEIRGKLHYFGTDKQQAHKGYLAVASHLHGGYPRPHRIEGSLVSVKIVAHRYMAYQEARMSAGEISAKFAIIRAMFNYALDSEQIEHLPPVKKGLSPVSVKQLRSCQTEMRRKHGPRVFSPEQLRRVLSRATGPLKAMALLGINGGFGNKDCAELRVKDIDFERAFRRRTAPDSSSSSSTNTTSKASYWKAAPRVRVERCRAATRSTADLASIVAHPQT